MKKYLLGITIFCLLTSCSGIGTKNAPFAHESDSSTETMTTYSPTPWPLPTSSKPKVECEEYFNDLKAELSTVVEPFENCLKLNNYAFKKFQLPNSTNDYYGYVGSNLPVPNENPSCWMDPDTRHGCLLYKVVKGKPTIISLQSFPSDDYNNKDTPKGPLLESALVGVKNDGVMIFFHSSYEICFGQSYGTIDFTRDRFKAWIPYIEYGGADSCNAESKLTFYPQDAPQIEIILEKIDIPNPMIKFIYAGKTIGEIKVKNTSLLSWNGGNFPNNKDLQAYALQNDRSKFSFFIEGKKYTIDLTTSTPQFLY